MLKHRLRSVSYKRSNEKSTILNLSTTTSYHNVSTCNLKPVEVLAGILCVEDVLVNNICCSPCTVIGGVTKSDLSQSAVLAEYIVHLFC
jgi:hypothetical protein